MITPSAWRRGSGSPMAPAASTMVAGVVIVMLALLAACSGDDGTTTPTPTVATTADGGEDTAEGDAEFCAAAQQVAADAEDPEALAGSLGDLAAVAPDGLAEELALVTTALDGLDMGDPSDPQSFVELLELLLDPEIARAMAAVDEVTVAECGVSVNAPGAT